MLTKYTLTLQADTELHFHSEITYRLYAVLLENASADYAKKIHTSNITPIAQHLSPTDDNRFIWTIGLLGDEAERNMCPVIECINNISLRSPECTLRVVSRTVERVNSIDDLMNEAIHRPCIVKIEFETTTSFKSHGRYQILPNMQFIVNNLIMHWNGCIDDCPIEDTDGRGSNAIARGMYCTGMNIHDSAYYIKQNKISGFSGTMIIENQLEGFHRQLLNMLLIFARYSGIGIKTSLGMGAVNISFLKNNRSGGD